MDISKYVDLHLHSTCSDGVHPPETVVEMAAEAGLSTIAICDHDNIDAIPIAQAAGRAAGIEILNGVELSVVHEEIRDIHLLGYGFDPEHPELVRDLNEFQAFRARRNALIVDNINDKLGAAGREPIDFEAVSRRAGGTVGRPHIARELMARGYVKTLDAAFDEFLVPCNVAKRFFLIADAIELIQRAGGVAVLAHPAYIGVDDEKFRHLLDTFTGFGLDGVEVYFRGVGRQRIDWYLTEARQRGLLVTGGSDFHADGDIAPGFCSHGNLRIPYFCYEEVRAALGG